MEVELFKINQKGGKSAVITGLQLCLGSKASKTNRAESLKQLIKEGEEF
jgi:structural maintenance of chromosomes protein 6